MEKKVYLLDSDRLDHYWPEIEGLLASVPGFYDLYTPQWVYGQAKMGAYQIWALSDGAIRGIMITQIAVFPKAKVFDVLAAAGSRMLEFFDEADSTFEWIARDSECEFMRATFRPGLARKMKPRGDTIGVVMTRRLSPMRIQ